VSARRRSAMERATAAPVRRSNHPTSPRSEGWLESVNRRTTSEKLSPARLDCLSRS
jgi:hypothetical protein